MRLTDLAPKWIMRDGARIGFTFISPTDPKWRQSCFLAAPPTREQWDMFEDDDVQGCTTGTHWQIAGGIETATFETLTVTPSIDGSKGGLWHGFIQNGEIK